MHKLILVCLIIGLIGCGKSQEEIKLEKEAQAKALEQEKLKKIKQERSIKENEIKELIKNDLLDPESARFKFQSASDPNIYCGTVNSKNTFGGYVGDKRFLSWGKGYSIDDYKPSDDLFPQMMHLLGFEETWITKCEGVRPKAGVNLKECENYAEAALKASYYYINQQDINFSDLKRILLKDSKYPKHISNFLDAVRKLNLSSTDQEFPMRYAIVQYGSCLEGNTSY